MSAPTSDTSADRWLKIGSSAMLVFALWQLTRSWHESILDRYEFRQLQTALSVFWIQHGGFHLNYLTPLFGPPWSVPMEFPTYQICVAALSNTTGFALEQAGRLTSILFLFATFPAAYDLLALAELRPSRRLFVIAFILVTPVYLFYARTVLIETAALCFAVWFLALLRRSLATPRWGWTLAATIAGVLAALTKITTFAVFCPPALVLALWMIHSARRHDPRARATFLRLVAAAVPVAAALAVGFWWIAHADGVKDSNPFSGFLKSTEMRPWNYGPLALRFDSAFWAHFTVCVEDNILTSLGLAFSLLAATMATPRARWIALTCLAGFITGPLVFANLYHVHDYYYTANALLLTGAAGVLLASAWENPLLPRAGALLLLGLATALQMQAFRSGYAYYHSQHAPPPPDIATIIRETVPADGVVLVYGHDWNPLLPYYIERRAIMVPGERENETAVLEQILAQLPPRRILGMVTAGEKFRQRPDFIRERAARFGLSPHPFATGSDFDFYLPASAVPPAVVAFRDRKFNTARVLVSPIRSTLPADAKEQMFAAGDVAAVTSLQLRARSQFGVSLASVEGRLVLNAHAPSEITVASPVGARHITALAGLPAGAYANPAPAATDGIVVEIFEESADGLRRSVYRRSLEPATKPADRGPQEISVENSVPFVGRLVFAITPGPGGNSSYDWAYWARIDIR